MALILPGRFAFLRVPKTGSRWASAVIGRAVEVQDHRTGRRAGSWARWGHADIADVGDAAPFRFAFVRNPADWWRSWFTHESRAGWPDLAADLRVGGFASFVDRVIEQHPGYVGRMFARFVGEPGAEIDFIGRHETLRADLGHVLARFGIAADLDAAPINVAPRVVSMTSAQRSRLEQAEPEAMARFYAC